MALPGDLSTATITAIYQDSSGGFCTGRVTFTPTAPIKAVDGTKVLFNKAIVGTLNGSGALSVVVPVGDAQYTPSPIVYLVSEEIDGQAGKFGDSYYISLATGDATTTISLLSRTHVSAP